MKKYVKVTIFYILFLLGLFLVSWLIWARFLRERTIRDIPDNLFTEFRFWILLYLCFIYAYVIKSLVIDRSSSSEIISHIVKVLYIPLTTFDHTLKYNRYITNSYEKLILVIMTLLNKASKNQIIVIIFLLQILPRIILVIFLVLDTFWFHKLEIMYKVILLGLLPLIFRYIDYSLKDIYQHWIEILELHYTFIYVFQEDYEYDFKFDEEFIPPHHYKQKSIKEYIEIKYENWKDYSSDKVDYEYVGSPYLRDEIVQKYRKEKYNNDSIELSWEDYEDLRKLFKRLLPQIIGLKDSLENISQCKDNTIIKRFKIIIFTLYLICWGYILITSEYYYPATFQMTRYFLENLMRYLVNFHDDPFSMSYEYSFRKNRITIETITIILKQILTKILEIIC